MQMCGGMSTRISVEILARFAAERTYFPRTPRLVIRLHLLNKNLCVSQLSLLQILYFNYIRTDVSTQEWQQKTRQEGYSHRVCQLILLTCCVFYKYFFKTSTLSSFSQGKSKSLRPKCP